MSSNRAIALMGKTHGRLVHARRVAVIAERLAGMLEPGCKLLDVGCGDGKLASILKERVPGLDVQGVEVLPRADCAISCTKYDGTHLPFPDDSFDACLFVDVLHHTTDPLPVLRDACRVSRKFVLIKDHLANNAFDFSTLKFMDWVGNSPHGVVLPYNYLSSVKWRNLFDEVSLKEVSSDSDLPIYPFPFSLVFGKKLHFAAILQKQI
jgi:ubiquinone/menaquinone biosynthesis C-methylase UbiE